MTRTKPVEFELGQVIPGWTEGLKLIGKGGKITLWIPAELAYGRQARGKYILPNSALKFEVELEDVIPFVEETTPATTDEACGCDDSGSELCSSGEEVVASRGPKNSRPL